MSEAVANDLASDALQKLTEHVFANMKKSSPILEDLVKAASRYHAAMEQVNQAQSVFIDCLGKAGVAASQARGGTADIGSGLNKLTARHHEIRRAKEEQTRKLLDQLIVPLQKRLKSDAKTLAKMEEDFKSMTRAFKNDLKKAGSATVKAQKQSVKKRGDGNAKSASDKALHDLIHRSKGFEAFNQKCLKSVMIEERRRYCYLVDNYASVFLHDFDPRKDKALFSELLGLADNPEDLPQSSEDVRNDTLDRQILQNSSNGLLFGEDPGRNPSPGPMPAGAPPPSPLTQEFASKLKAVPPGAPAGGVEYQASSDQLNPVRSGSRPGGVRGGVAVDLLAAHQKSAGRPGAQ